MKSKPLVLCLLAVGFTFSESSNAQSVRLDVLKAQAVAAPKDSLDPGEEIVTPKDDQKRMDEEFNSRRLLRFHQLWNLYLFRNEEAARTLKSEVDAMITAETQPAMEEELARAEAEGREPTELRIVLSPETSKARTRLNSKNEFNETARKESDATRLTKVHAGLPPEQVTKFIEENAKALTKRLRTEIAAGGDNAEKAKANLAYLQGTLLPKINDPQYFSVSRTAFAKEFSKVVGSSGAQTGR